MKRRFKNRKKLTKKASIRKWNKGAKQKTLNKPRTSRGGYRL